jgi:hypothetical protein
MSRAPRVGFEPPPQSGDTTRKPHPFFLFCQYCPENPNSSPYNVYGEVCVIKKPVVDELRKERKVKISLI